MGETVEIKQARLEELLQGLISRLDERCSIRKDVLVDHEVRIKTMESVIQQAKGGWVMMLLMLSGSAVLGGGVVALIMHFFGKPGGPNG